MFVIIAAIGKNRELGEDGQLLFHLKADMQFFKEITWGQAVVMGRKTWDSLPRKLAGRRNVVISTYPEAVKGEPDEIVSDLAQYIADNKGTAEEIFVIGGGEIYQQFLPLARELVLTEIAAEKPADTYFPQFEPEKYRKTLIKKGAENGVEYQIARYTLI